MTTLSLQPGLRPAQLPPTLQPHAVLSIAPPTDRRRSAAVSAAVYAIIAGGLIWLGHAGAMVVQRMPVPIGSVTLNEPSLPSPVPHAAPMPKNADVPVIATTHTAPLDTSLAPSTMPTAQNSAPLTPPVTPAVSTDGPGTGGGPITLSGDAVRILHQVDPIYPALAMAAHLQGQVVVRMTIDERGLPSDVEAISGPQVFQGPALRAARQWRFESARQNGVAVPATFLLTLNFVLR